MPLLVQKYGGTSVDGPQRIQAVARRVAAARAAGNDTVVVVSAMGQATDELLRLAHQISPRPRARERDMLLTAGERITMALLAMALHDLGVEAISFTGSQSGILTDDTHGGARIRAIRPDRISAELERGRVVIVAGFQGVNPETREITTLGRGGSDTTAVALAAALGPGRCEIYTDVSGIHTADPGLVPGAPVLAGMSYRLCSSLAHLGGRVLHARCVDLAAARRVPLTVGSSFDERPGTRIVEDEMEGSGTIAIAHRDGCSLAMAEGFSGARGEARAIIEAVARALPELELVAHERTSESHGLLVWAGSRADVEALERDFRELRGPGGEWKLGVQHGAAFVSVVGLGLGAAQVVRAEAALDAAGVSLVSLRTTPTALIFRVPTERCADAVRALHRAFVEQAAPADSRS